MNKNKTNDINNNALLAFHKNGSSMLLTLTTK